MHNQCRNHTHPSRQRWQQLRQQRPPPCVVMATRAAAPLPRRRRLRRPSNPLVFPRTGRVQAAAPGAAAAATKVGLGALHAASDELNFTAKSMSNTAREPRVDAADTLDHCGRARVAAPAGG